MDPSSVCTCNPPVSPCIPTCPNHIRTLPTCFHINIKPNAPPSFVLPAMSNASYVIDMNFNLEINIRAVNENVLDPVIITAPVVLPIGASLAPILGDSQNTYLFKWTPASYYGGWSQVQSNCGPLVSPYDLFLLFLPPSSFLHLLLSFHALLPSSSSLAACTCFSGDLLPSRELYQRRLLGSMRSSCRQQMLMVS
mmetsp:Transcript_48663/g.152771  ORF Transcript_48663/g.152771 Transcript_48663/m.152771 type:complete len:195 (-) Transcript_48663:413-997(-)